MVEAGLLSYEQGLATYRGVEEAFAKDASADALKEAFDDENLQSIASENPDMVEIS